MLIPWLAKDKGSGLGSEYVSSALTCRKPRGVVCQTQEEGCKLGVQPAELVASEGAAERRCCSEWHQLVVQQSRQRLGQHAHAATHHANNEPI